MKHSFKIALPVIAALTALVFVFACGCVKHTHIVVESRRVGDYFCSFYEDGTAELISYAGEAEELMLPEYVDGYRMIGFGMKAFDGCVNLKVVYIPDTVTSLPAKLFNACPVLEKVYIPRSVREAGKNAIFECPAFTTVLYGGTEQEWNSINVGSVPWTDNYTLINADIVFEYSAG